jgi:shikimate kinase/3-dehydroquinate synthase
MCLGDSRNLILTGFMGTGKTTVGREVAQRLRLPFVDMDLEIGARAGKSIPRIFAEDGEATFREMEAALCEELGRQRGLVIATGGGALVDPSSRAALMTSGTVVCLTCDVKEIVRRLDGGADSDRPLLSVADPHGEIQRLLEVRREAYSSIPWQVDTTGLSVEEIAEQAMQFSRVVTLPVGHAGGSYAIHIGTGLLAHAGDALRASGTPGGNRVAVVSNPAVAHLYGAQVEEALRSAGFEPMTCTVPDGEEHKTLATVHSLYEQFLAAGLDRSGTVLSLGGGVTGDIAGFAAATYLRGLRFAQIPTTILAMADASVGGKTGVDLPQGKNLVGAFKQPALVVMDPAVLATLPLEEIRSGAAEVIKHGVIGSPELFAELEVRAGVLSSWWEGDGVSWIVRALRVKVDIVEQDPYEEGRRAVLNLGHTVGHGLERLSGYTLRHGEAVGIGMVAAARMAAELGWANRSLAERIEAVLAAWGLPVRCPPFDVAEIWEAMSHDKKQRGGTLRWVLPRAVGDVAVAADVPPMVVRSILRDLGARSEK